MASFIDYDNKFIFVHVPKTAGTATTGSLVGLELNSNQAFFNHAKERKDDRNIEYIGPAGHITTKEIRGKIGDKKYESFFKFTVMREPYSWLVSMFEWRYQPTIFSAVAPYHYSNFEMFIDAFFDVNEKLQSDWFTSDNKIQVDLIGNFSNLEKELDKVSNTCGIQVSKLRRVNVKKQYKTSDHYSNKRITDKATGLLEKDLQLYEELFGTKRKIM